MWLVSVSVMLAVVQWASSAGGSPRLPTRRTPPRFGASAAPAATAIASTVASDRTVRIRALRVDIFVDLFRLGVGCGQRELHTAVDLRLHVGLDPLEDARVGELLCREPGGQRLEWIVRGHPLLLFLACAVLAVAVADVVAVVAVGLALEKGRALAAARALDQLAHRRVDELDVLAVDGLGV